MTRNSPAWNPDDGRVYRNGKPRFTEGNILYTTFEPKVYYTFDEPEPFMAYDTNGHDYTSGTETLQERQTRFENEYPEFDRVTLGSSFQGREIIAYRLGPIGRKHFCIMGGIHGNEVDGINGSFKACEILAREAVFSPFRDEWTLFFVPALNPDGWYLGTRNLAQTGPNGLTINLNRQWDWFWDEYVETDFESKGSAPGSSAEATAFLNYINSGDAGNPVEFGFSIDHHANRGTGSRYQSRDRIWRDIQLGPTEGGLVPNNYRTIWLDWILWRLAGNFSAVRTRDAGGPDLYVRYFRSRFRPHYHSWMSSQGIASVVIEELKVTDAGGRETVASACNYRLDYTLASAVVVTDHYWATRGTMLIEKGATNILNNAEWNQWQDLPEFRPGWYTHSRASLERVQKENSYLEDGGRSVKITSETDIVLSSAAEFNAMTQDQPAGVAVLTAYGQLFTIPPSEYKAGDVGSLSTHTETVGAALIYAGSGFVDAVGGGTAETTGATTKVTRIDTSDASETPQSALPSARMHAAFCDNFLDFPSAGNEEGYICGGHDGASPLTSMGVWDAGAGSFSPSAQNFPTARYGGCAVYVPTSAPAGGGSVFVFGGLTAGGSPLDEIYEWEPTPDNLFNRTSSVGLPVALGYLAGAYWPGDGMIYLYGGQDASGDMVDTVYQFDPGALTITEIDLDENLTDEEGYEVAESTAEREWERKLGRWDASIWVEDAADDGTILLVGGREDDTSGSLSADFFEHDVEDVLIGLPRTSNFGFIRYSTPLEETWEEVANEDFASALGAEWTDPNGAWTVTGGEGRVSGTAGPLILSTQPPTYKAHRVRMQLSTTGTITRFRVVLRGSYTGATLDDGYQLRNDDGSTTWYLDRVVSGTPINITSFSVSQAVDGTPREISFGLIESYGIPRFVIEWDGSTVTLDTYDPSPDRHTDTGVTSVDGQTSSGVIAIDDYILDETGMNEARYSGSILAQAGDQNVSGYNRLNLQPKTNFDPSDTDFSERRVRNYYTIPPANIWHWYRGRVDLSEGHPEYVEDGLRFYSRIYKDSQVHFLDGICLAKGSVLGTTFTHPDTPRVDEEFRWASAFDLNHVWAEIWWLPTFGFPDVSVEGDLEIIRLEVDANNYLRVVLLAGERWEREYNIRDVHAAHDPVIRLEKVRGGSVTDSIDLICYYGYMMREPSIERVDDPVKFTIIHQQTARFEFRIERYGRIGRKSSVTDLTAFSYPAQADLVYNGQGYYSEPDVVVEDTSNGGTLVPVGRTGLRGRLMEIDNDGPLMSGERDPTGGQIVFDMPFIEDDDFERANDSNLGTEWDIIYQTGAGFNVAGGKAECTDIGFELRDGRPKHRDVIMEADLSVENDGDIVGLLGRMDEDREDFTGYGCELRQSSGSLAQVRIVSYFANQRTVLAAQSLSSWSPGDEVHMIFTLAGDQLTGEIVGRGTVNVTDTLHQRPGQMGIMGETGGPSQAVTIDNWDATENFAAQVTS